MKRVQARPHGKDRQSQKITTLFSDLAASGTVTASDGSHSVDGKYRLLEGGDDGVEISLKFSSAWLHGDVTILLEGSDLGKSWRLCVEGWSKALLQSKETYDDSWAVKLAGGKITSGDETIMEVASPDADTVVVRFRDRTFTFRK